MGGVSRGEADSDGRSEDRREVARRRVAPSVEVRAGPRVAIKEGMVRVEARRDETREAREDASSGEPVSAARNAAMGSAMVGWCVWCKKGKPRPS